MESSTDDMPLCKDARDAQSVACHDKRIEAASIELQFDFENVPIAFCRPLNATPRWRYDKFSVSLLPVK
jgi:hypothetical protein